MFNRVHILCFLLSIVKSMCMKGMLEVCMVVHGMVNAIHTHHLLYRIYSLVGG